MYEDRGCEEGHRAQAGEASHFIRLLIAETEILIILLSVMVLASVVSFFLPLTRPFPIIVLAVKQYITYLQVQYGNGVVILGDFRPVICNRYGVLFSVGFRRLIGFGVARSVASRLPCDSMFIVACKRLSSNCCCVLGTTAAALS